MKPKSIPPNAKAVTPTRTKPVAPPVYRPQPLPLVAQRKSVAAPAYRPQPAPKVLQAKSISQTAPVARPNGIIQRAMTPPGAKIDRPNFKSIIKRIALRRHNLNKKASFKVDMKKPDLPSHNAAIPHRMSYKDIRDSIVRFSVGAETAGDFDRWTTRFIDAGKKRINGLVSDIALEEKNGPTPRLQELKNQLIDVQKAHDQFTTGRVDFMHGKLGLEKFIDLANGFHANVPDLGPHNGCNNVVGPYLHLNFVQDGKKKQRSLSPGSEAAARMSPPRVSGLPVTQHGNYISTGGDEVEEKDLSKETKEALAKHKKVVIPSFDPKAKFGK